MPPSPAPGNRLKTPALRLRKALWRVKNRIRRAAKNRGRAGLPQPSGRGGAEPVWFYADRAHRAGDNAEAFYRYARAHLPGVRHVFLLAETSPDWPRLADEGFELVGAGSPQAALAWRQAHTLLLSDISDSAVKELLGNLGASQRLVFLQHGVLRRPLWRWLNPRRVDLLVTTLAAEEAAVVADGSSYTLSGPEVLRCGLPRHDRLLELAAGEHRRDYLLVAPTWSPTLLGASTEALVDWVGTWMEPLTGALPGVEPVFFLHPNLERYLVELGLTLPVKTIYGLGLPEALVRAVAVVSDVSSIADEGLLLGIPAILVGDRATGNYGDSASWEQEGLHLVGAGDKAELVAAVRQAREQGRGTPRIEPGAAGRLLEALGRG